MKKNRLSTFVGDEPRLKAAISAGADQLILEDSKLAVRSYTDDFNVAGFTKIAQLAQLARALNPQIELAFNCDLLVHHKHWGLIEEALHVCRKEGISIIRIQDPGLIQVVQALYPEASIHLATETGNNNLESMAFYQEQGVARQTLTNELPASQMTEAIDKLGGLFEHQVHGPILIQYTYRRLMSGLRVHQGEETGRAEDLPPIMQKFAQDDEHPNRFFPFYDNPHGHLMYMSFDKCLLKYVPELAQVGLDYWLIDARGESEEYLVEALKAYRRALLDWQKNPQDYCFDKTLWDRCAHAARRPFKSGFFLANRTDNLPTKKELFSDYPRIGRVVDVIKGDVMTLEACAPIHVGDFCLIVTPEGRKIEYVIEKMTDFDHNECQSVATQQYIKVKWAPKVVPQSVIYRYES